MKTNVFYHGDCLFVMRHDIPPESIDLVYLDPPFFTGKVQKGEWKKNDKRKQRTEDWEPGAMQISYDDSKAFWSNKEIQENAPIWLKDIATWNPKSHWYPFARYLYYMMERLQECKNVLKSTGSIYLHCDWNASHYLKMVMDEIFGYKNFQNEIVWGYSGRETQNMKHFPRKHNIILFYTKNEKEKIFKLQFKPYRKEYIKQFFKYKESNGRRYRLQPGKDGEYKQYLDETKGQPINDVWSDIRPIHGFIGTSKDEKNTGYPTQKPEKLLDRIIDTSSKKGDIVLDPFCGCGTTIIAAHNFGREWIGIDIHPRAFDIIKDRCEQSSLTGIFKPPILVNSTKGIYEWVITLNGKEFEDWVNEFYKAKKPSPDRGVDGITKDGIAIQSKTNIVKYNIVSQLLTDARHHKDVPKHVKVIRVVSQKGFDDSARQLAYEIESTEKVKVELVTPKDMLKTEDLTK